MPNMLERAVRDHSALTSTSPPNTTQHQSSLRNALNRTISTPKSASRPLPNDSRNNGADTPRQFSGQVAHGVKRTSSGLAKSLSSHSDMVHYPSLNIVGLEKENRLPSTYYTPSSNGSTSLASALFDENDFDSDIDLEVDNPSTKATAVYPNPTTFTPYKSSVTEQDSKLRIARAQAESQSSQPIPWSSSPPEHLKVPQSSVPSRVGRSTLPWEQVQNVRAAREETNETESEEEQSRSRKKGSLAVGRTESTPASKTSDSPFLWNTTASALKQQQKAFREQAKASSRTSKASNENVKEAGTKKKADTVHTIFLSKEQQNVLSLVTEHRKSVFFTGSAGTGKSVLLREIIAALRRKFINEPDRVAVTASTGLAACNIGGVTMHSFAGIGLGKEPAEDLIKKIRRNAKSKQRWLRTKVLIMDEVSMVDGDMFDKLEQIARTIRNNGRPFGGIQLVITGDFFQLPPVPEYGRQSKFAFDAGTWTTSVEHTIGLHHVFRQKDPVFAGMLNEMREGRLSLESITKFKQLERPLSATDDSIEATELFPTRQEVDRANNARMQQLHGNTFTFDARDGGTMTNKEQRDRLLQNCMVPEQVHLKKGAQVMLVKNMDDTLVNGSLGKVTGFMTEQMFAIYKENEEAFLQGGFSEQAMRTEIAKTSLGLSTAQVFPLVRFAIPDGTTRDLLCKREEWKNELPNGEVQASRSQVPLVLAWALSIHKAQGQTLERVRVDLGKVFEKGQAYVALSRATSMAGLQILRFDAKKVIAHERVRSFYSSLSTVERVEAETKDKAVAGKTQGAKARAR